MTTIHERIIILSAAFTERYVLSLVYLFLALMESGKIWSIRAGQMRIETTVFIDTAHHLILLLLCLFTSLLLLLGRRATVPPTRLKFILIPLATTFFNFFYYAIPLFPAALQIKLCPPGWQTSLTIAGLACIITGPVIALWGIAYLGRSFGVFVTVRKVVVTEPYQWVRHPMYLGWVWICLGVALANFSAAYFLIVAIHIFLLLYRARLEEAQLAANSPEYREYMKRTGFIFPRIHRV